MAASPPIIAPRVRTATNITNSIGQLSFSLFLIIGLYWKTMGNCLCLAGNCLTG